jgi:N4-gp56 family major capsid protein
MPLGSPAVNNTRAATFIPELWSDEIIAAYKKNLVAANLMKKMSFKGKKGDSLHIPKPTRGDASLKQTETQVTLIAATESEVVVNIDQHYEYSRFIEDITETQALASLRKFYTDDAGYALAKRVDTDLLVLGREAQGGASTNAYTKAYLGGDGATLYVAASNNESAITDAGFRRAIQRLDDADVPMDSRSFIIPPSTRNTMMGLSRFTEQAFIGNGDTIRNGQIGDIYGVKVYVTTNATTTSGSGGARICLLFHPDFAVLAEQMGVRVQTQYKQEWLATLLTADTLYGVKVLRNDAAVALAVPA